MSIMIWNVVLIVRGIWKKYGNSISELRTIWQMLRRKKERLLVKLIPIGRTLIVFGNNWNYWKNRMLRTNRIILR